MANEIQHCFDYSIQCQNKAEKLEAIRLFEDAGFILSKELSDMLHKNAPTYPRDFPYLELDHRTMIVYHRMTSHSWRRSVWWLKNNYKPQLPAVDLRMEDLLDIL